MYRAGARSSAGVRPDVLRPGARAKRAPGRVKTRNVLVARRGHRRLDGGALGASLAEGLVEDRLASASERRSFT